MKISIERAVLLRAVSQAQSVVERRNTIPILSNVLIEADDNSDTVRFRATDLDIEVIDKATAQIERGGATTVSATMLHEIVRKLPDGALVELSENAGSRNGPSRRIRQYEARCSERVPIAFRNGAKNALQ